MALVLLLLVPLALAGQTLNIASASAAVNQKVPIAIFVQSTPGKQPLILQFDVTFPAPQLKLDPADLKAAPAVEKLKKTITCRGGWRKAPQTYYYRCILAGGVETISDGAVAMLWFQVPPNAKPGKAPIRLEESEALLPGLKREKLKAAQGVITITP